MPEELVPPVVAIVVTSDPGEWFENCLESLRTQDYPNLMLLVVDDGSTAEVTARVAAVEPTAIVRRRAERGGYSLAANEALTGVEGATFFLFCHDDVALGEGAVRALVEQSYRLNSGVTGPKLLRSDDPSLLAQVGIGMHRLGTPAPRVETGELDQSQHDEVAEVFAVSGACMLVRADLFEALRGFDPAMTLFGEDIDFCWRAQVAGARVVVAPTATARHRETAAAGERPAEVVGDIRLLQRRHELRAALKNYGLWRRWAVTGELAVLGLAEAVVAAFTGERERGRRVWRAWRWNFSERASLKEARRQVRELRQVSDRALVSRMSPRGRSRSWWSRLRWGEIPAGQVVCAAVLVVFIVLGMRDVLFSRLPLVGQFVPMPTGSALLGQYFGGRSVDGSLQVSPPSYGLIGLLALPLGNSSALAIKVITFAALAAGAIGVSRLCRAWESRRARLAGAVAFLLLPFTWNAVATGSLETAVALGATPYVLARLARAAGLAPFGKEQPGGSRLRQAVSEAAPLGLLLAVLVALAPAALVGAGAIVLAVALACLLEGSAARALRALAIALGAVVVAFCCLLPWSATWFGRGASWSALTGAVPGSAISVASLLRGHVGPVGAWWGAFGFLVAGGYALVVARGERSRWAIVLWLTVVTSVALAWAGSSGWLGAGVGASGVVVAPAGTALAALCGLAVAAFERDVTKSALGWRHAGALVAGACAVAAVVPALGAAVGGHANLPSTGFDDTLDWTVPSAASPYRVLWLGEPRSLPAEGWQLAPGVSWYATTSGLPGPDNLWPPASPGRLAGAARAIEAAEHGSTADVGALLAPMGVRYLVIPDANAPVLPGTEAPSVIDPPSERLVDAFQSQGDLIERPAEAGTLVFVNADWSSRDGAGLSTLAGRTVSGASMSRAPSPPAGSSGVLRDLGIAGALTVWVLALVEGAMRRRRVA